MLFNNSSNNFNSTDKVSFVGILYFSMNVIQYIGPESIRTQKIGFWIWSDLQINSDIRGKMSKFGSEMIAVLR